MTRPPDRRRSSPLLKILVTLGASLLALLGAEGAHRIWLRSQGRPYDSSVTRVVLELMLDPPDQLGGAGGEEQVDPQSKQGVLHPFFGFDVLGALVQIARDQTYFASGRGDHTYDLVLLGGSVAAGFGNKGVDHMRELIGEDPRFQGRKWRVMNYARASYKQPQQIALLVYLLNVGIRPDAVINLDGFNEVAQSNVNVVAGTHPLQPAVSQWGAFTLSVFDEPEVFDQLLDLRLQQLDVERLARRGLNSHLLWSSVFGNWVVGEVTAGKRQQVAAQETALASLGSKRSTPVIRGPQWEGDLEQLMAYCVRSWEVSSRAIDAICKRNSIYYVHVLQPTLHDEGAKVATREEKRVGKASAAWRDAVRVGYPLMRERGKALALEGVAFVDATMVFRDVAETLYVDACHFSREGQELLGAAIAAGFLAQHE